MSHFTLSIRPSRGGLRKFAVLTKEPAVSSDWQSGNIWCQSNQTWEADVWQRIDGRGFVCRLTGGGQWSNRGIHGRYIGTGSTAEAALLAAWQMDGDGSDDRYDDSEPPRSLIAKLRDYDAEHATIAVE